MIFPLSDASPLPDPGFWSGRRVFLTGHTGFKGTWLAFWLHRMGAEVHGFSLAPEAGSLGEAADVEGLVAASRRGDIRDAEGLAASLRAADPEIVFHLAAQPLVLRSYEDPLGTLATNALGTANLLEAVRAATSVRAVVVVTTDKCYENREWSWPYREDDALGGHDPYSMSKAAAELVAASWRRSFLAARQVGVATARAGNVVGGGDAATDRLVPDCIRAFMAGRTVVIRNPVASRPWQHVVDPLCGYLLLAERLADDHAFATAWNFGPGLDDVRPVRDVVDRLAVEWGDGASWSTSPGNGAHEAGLLAVDASRARRLLGWRTRLSLAEALGWTVRWHKAASRSVPAAELVGQDIARYVGTATGVSP